MNVKTALITGATGGIGHETALALARQGYRLIITGRDAVKGPQIADELKRQTGNADVAFAGADMASLAQTRALAETVRQRFDRLDVLINNAGFLSDERETTDGLETNFAVNALNPMLLIHSLLPLLERTPGSRVVNLLTGSHLMADKRRIADYQSETQYRGMEVYGRTKLYNLLILYRLVELHPTIRFYATNPGGNYTAMMQKAIGSGKGWPLYMRLIRPVALPLFRWIMRNKPLSEGARSTVYAATSPELAHRTGLYLSPAAKVVRSSTLSYSQALQTDVYEYVMRMLKPYLTQNQPV